MVIHKIKSNIQKINKQFYLWKIRNFKVISNEEAKELGLKHIRNVNGDEINHLNCRSIWIDSYLNIYRCTHLENNLPMT